MKNLLNSDISRMANSASLVVLCNIGSITVFITATIILHSKPFLSGKKMELQCSDLYFTTTCLFSVIWRKILNLCEEGRGQW